MTDRQLGDDLREYIKDARATLGLTPPSFDDYRASDDAFTSLAGLQALLDWAATVPEEGMAQTVEQAAYEEGFRTALLHALVQVEDAIADSLAHFEEYNET